MSVLVVIPAWNEAANLEAVIGELREMRPDDDILVIDDGSTDATSAVACEMGARCVRLPIHLGYGAAVQTGIKYGLRDSREIVVTFDGDGQHDPRDVASLVLAIRDGADLVIGSRRLCREADQGGWARQAGRAAFAGLARALTGLSVTDPTSGFKALGERAQRLYALARFPDRFPDADALVLARRSDLRVVERPARMRPSRNDHSMHGGLRGVAYAFNMLLSLLAAHLGRVEDLRR